MDIVKHIKDAEDQASELPPLGEWNRCRDFDSDCQGLNYLNCWLYATERGWCPFLRAKAEEA